MLARHIPDVIIIFSLEQIMVNKLAATFIKKETLAHMFPCEFCEISKNTFFTEHL